MKIERIYELIIHFENTKKTTEYLINSTDFDGNKKETAKIALAVFNDTLEVFNFVLKNLEKDELNNGDNGGQQSE